MSAAHPVYGKPASYSADEDDPGYVDCSVCGAEMHWEDCTMCGAEGDVMVEDDLGRSWVETCPECHGKGGWWWCPRAREEARAAEKGEP